MPTSLHLTAKTQTGFDVKYTRDCVCTHVMYGYAYMYIGMVVSICIYAQFCASIDVPGALHSLIHTSKQSFDHQLCMEP